MSVPLLWWYAPGPYRVAFSTRRGGVSEGPYDSLNLGLLTDDRDDNVEENRHRLCEALDADPGFLLITSSCIVGSPLLSKPTPFKHLLGQEPQR